MMKHRVAMQALIGIVLAQLMSSSVAAAERGISDNVIRIGVINDQAGPYADLAGGGSVVAAKMAADEFANAIDGAPIEIVSADHQNKPDVGAAIARRWIDSEKVDVIADISNSGVAFAVIELAKERSKIVLNMAGSSDFTGKACSPISFQWVYNSHTNSIGLANALMKQKLDSWYIIAVDFAFGHAMAGDLRKAVEAHGGKIVGEVYHPLNSSDFASVILQAQASKAKAVVLANAGADLANSMKQAGEFGLTQSQTLAAPLVFLSDVDAMGLQVGQGLQFLTGFYWNLNEETRAWAQKFFDRFGRMPTMTQAGVYSAVRHYLKAVQKAKTDDTATVTKTMREMPVSDAFGKGTLRADGQFVHDLYLVRVKKPAESKMRWDYYNILETVPGNEVFTSLADSACPLAKQ
jgi:branched-chain amino acid transport system substrate-binding protein